MKEPYLFVLGPLDRKYVNVDVNEEIYRCVELPSPEVTPFIPGVTDDKIDHDTVIVMYTKRLFINRWGPMYIFAPQKYSDAQALTALRTGRAPSPRS